MRELSELGISPAPWTVSDAQNYWIEDANRTMVCDGLTYRGNDESADTEEHSNASLIAAAPELYKCLHEAVIEVCHGHACCGMEYECNGVDGDCFVKRWRAALAKAAGEEVAK